MYCGMCGNIMMKKALQYTPDRQGLKTDAKRKVRIINVIVTERKYTKRRMFLFVLYLLDFLFYQKLGEFIKLRTGVI